jgi:hypothetical protein
VSVSVQMWAGFSLVFIIFIIIIIIIWHHHHHTSSLSSSLLIIIMRCSDFNTVHCIVVTFKLNVWIPRSMFVITLTIKNSHILFN